MAKPILEAVRRWGSRLEFSATTANTTSPGDKYFKPSLRAISLHCGGKMEETRTRFCAAMPASRSANSKDVRRSRCLPTPLVKKILLGTMSLPNSCSSGALLVEFGVKSNTVKCKGNMKIQMRAQKEAGTRLE